jgi:hypothetical protein
LIRQVFGWLDGVEVVVVAIIAAALLIFGPLFLVIRFYAAHHYLHALVLGVFWCGCIAACVRDFRRKCFSWVTGSLVALWVILTLLIGYNLS